jgi:prefoldin subunit 5
VSVSGLQARVKELESDKAELQVAIEELNSCYQEKIRLLEATIQGQQEKCEELLSWKQAHIDKSLFDVQRYED